jgi:hypothetical protein
MPKPKILKRLEQQLKDKGKSADAAHKIAVAALQKSGNLKKGSTEATAKGKKRGEMTAGERAKDRGEKYSKGKHKASEFVYNKKTNRVRLKKNG